MSEIAPYNGSRAKNVVFKPQADAVKPIILIIGTGDPTTEAGNELNKPILVTGPEDVGARTGFGFMLHRLSIQAAVSSRNTEMWYIQQPEPSGSQAAGEIDFTGSTGVEAGTYPLYISAIPAFVTITAGMTVEELADAAVAAINADSNLPVTAAKTAVTFEVVITSKSEGIYWGDNISIAVGINDEDIPAGIAAAITDMTGGAGTPDIQDALDSMGTDDDANEQFFTRMIASGYGDVAATVLDLISIYNGVGNDAVGCWAKLVHRPFMNRIGDVTAGSGGLSAAVAFGEGRKELDRTNGMVSVPGSRSHPAEIAANHQGVLAFWDATPYSSIANVALVGIDPGEKADRWTKNLAQRETAAQAGISVTQVKSGVVFVQTDENFYHPAAVPTNNNGYRAGRTVNITRNILTNNALGFGTENWQNTFIVSDVVKVGNSAARAKARDVGSVRDNLVALSNSYYDNGWLFDKQFPLDELKKDGSITINAGTNGFEYIYRFVVSGQLDIIDGLSEFDISAAIILGGN